MHFDFLIPKRPVSLQTRKTANLQSWKQYVRSEAAKTWKGQIFSGKDIQLTLIYLCNSDPVDTDNIIKPIQDALIGLIYDDDLLIADIDSHRRSLSGTFDLTLCPILLVQGITSGLECVYVRVAESKSLEDYL
ncbi:MAG: RusA family crossover junction endodeoxyribonuclease [Coleofasciculaceae cyanobacterium SM2_1_6]|nr:RusA family crossover junction endodeoxyribonuclease [Coleofasciculaceae cyanobacterium SM2_1_6]